jgi:flagellar FliJ protein
MAQPRFIFRLEPLLDLRKQEEKQRQRAVAVLQQEINGLLGRIGEAENQILRQDRELTAERLTGKLDMSYIAHEKRFVGAMRGLIATLQQQLAQSYLRMAQARGALLAAAKARKVIEKLRQRQFERWAAEQTRIENVQLDEIGTQLALRKLAEEAVGT